jgi:hypothetical protein
MQDPWFILTIGRAGMDGVWLFSRNLECAASLLPEDLLHLGLPVGGAGWRALQR